MWKNLNWRSPRVQVAAGVIALGATFAAGGAAAAMLIAGDKVMEKLSGFVGRGGSSLPAAAETQWQPLETALLSLEMTDIPLGKLDGNATGGGIHEFAGLIVHVSASGFIGSVDLSAGNVSYTQARVPMRYEETVNEYLSDKVKFNQNWYRVHDIHIRKTGAGRGELYVMHNLFEPETNQMCTQINRTAITVGDDGLSVSGDWELVYSFDTCLDMIEQDWYFIGHQSGGRMIDFDDGHLLVSIGDHGLPNFYKDTDPAQFGSGRDFSKVFKLDIATGQVALFAGGMRNPQGLAFDDQGRLWQTEHGPQGGDEINLLVEGGDYGWPNVSYGTEYGAPREPLALNPVQGRHDGFIKPVFAFVPSIGISNLIAIPQGEAFDLWAGDLFVLSLIGQTAYRVRIDDGRAIYAEPFRMGTTLRDVILLENGTIVILTGNASLRLIRDPKATAAASMRVSLSGYEAVSATEASLNASLIIADWGQQLFGQKCASCHNIDGSFHVAPPLNGIIGRDIAAYDSFPYSPALAGADGNWTRQKLSDFINHPDRVYPGTAMPAARGLDEYSTRALVRYIGELE